jgi:hypothetical protein
MDATRSRRTKCPERRRWYAYFRQVRFSRHMGFRDEKIELLYRPLAQSRASA